MFYHEKINTMGQVFNVDIVEPLVGKKSPPEILGQSFPASPPHIKRTAPKSILDNTPPRTLFGEDSGPDKGILRDQAAGQQGLSDPSGIKGNSEAVPEQRGVLPEEKKGLPLNPGEFLFDKETIEKYAQKKTPDESKGLTFDAPELEHRGYMKKLKDKIESVWHYPEEAARKGLSGELYINFSIHRDGSLGEVRLVRTSGYSFLDEAAMRAIKDSAPFWPLPDDFKEDEFPITGHFIYMLGDSFVM
ncbi:MAG: energy transducer TonB [Nitrospirae bacterium]|nr:energy transducer TonB [Nitrospirota bacterium]